MKVRNSSNVRFVKRLLKKKKHFNEHIVSVHERNKMCESAIHERNKSTKDNSFDINGNISPAQKSKKQFKNMCESNKEKEIKLNHEKKKLLK